MSDIVITGPDGSTFHFPAGTPVDAITGAMQSHYGGGESHAASQPTTQAPSSPSSGGSTLDNVVRATSRGVLGIGSYLDEADAAMNAALAPYVDPLLPDSFQKLPGKTYGERYDQALAIQRGKDASFDTAHPVASTALQLAGGLASGGAALRAAPTVAKAALGMGGKSLIARMLASGASGAGIGAIQGFGAGEGGAENRAVNSGINSILGGTIGAAVPVAGDLIGKGVKSVASRSANATSPLSTRATNLITGDLSKEGLTLPEANARAASFGPHGMIADASPTMQLRTEQIAQSDNPGRSPVIQALKDRSLSAGGRINSAYEASMGKNPNVNDLLQGLIKERSAAATPLYNQAYSAGDRIVQSPELIRIAGTPEVQDAMHSAVKGWQRSQIASGYGAAKPGLLINKIGEQGGVEVSSPAMKIMNGRVPAYPNLQFWDYTKNAIDDMVAHEIKPDGTLTKKGRDLTIIAKVMRNELDQQVPEYAAARQAWTGPTQAMNAFDRGTKIFSSSEHPDVLAADLANMSKGEQDAYKLGARAAVDKAMGTVRNGALKGRNLLDADWNHQKLLTVLGPQEGEKLANSLLGEQAMADTANQAIGNSATSRRMDNPFRQQQVTAAETPPGIVRSIANLKFGDAAAQGWSYIANALERRKVSNLAGELGPFLTARGSDRNKVVQALIDAQSKRNAAVDLALPPSRKALIQALLQSGQLAAAHPSGR